MKVERFAILAASIFASTTALEISIVSPEPEDPTRLRQPNVLPISDNWR